MKRLYKIETSAEEEILDALEKHADGYVYIVYSSSRPISPATASAMKKHPAFCYFEAKPRTATEEAAVKRKEKTDRELFEAFYEAKIGRKPDDALTEIFLRAVAGEEL